MKRFKSIDGKDIEAVSKDDSSYMMSKFQDLILYIYIYIFKNYTNAVKFALLRNIPDYHKRAFVNSNTFLFSHSVCIIFLFLFNASSFIIFECTFCAPGELNTMTYHEGIMSSIIRGLSEQSWSIDFGRSGIK